MHSHGDEDSHGDQSHGQMQAKLGHSSSSQEAVPEKTQHVKQYTGGNG